MGLQASFSDMGSPAQDVPRNIDDFSAYTSNSFANFTPANINLPGDSHYLLAGASQGGDRAFVDDNTPIIDFNEETNRHSDSLGLASQDSLPWTPLAATEGPLSSTSRNGGGGQLQRGVYLSNPSVPPRTKSNVSGGFQSFVDSAYMSGSRASQHDLRSVTSAPGYTMDAPQSDLTSPCFHPSQGTFDETIPDARVIMDILHDQPIPSETPPPATPDPATLECGECQYTAKTPSDFRYVCVLEALWRLD